jgi:hemolysin III
MSEASPHDGMHSMMDVGEPMRQPPHYPRSCERTADLIVHVVGLTLAVVGTALLIARGLSSGDLPGTAAVTVYATGLLAMLSFSTAYNFAPASRRPLLRKLDHAGIFLMIAGSYTPFTTQHLTGVWAWGLTSAVWAIAILGAATKLFLPQVGRVFSITFYVSLGWIGLVAIRPLLASVGWSPLALLGVGGLLYSVGVIFYAAKRLPFRRAVWHAHVVGGACAHWGAVCLLQTRIA